MTGNLMTKSILMLLVVLLLRSAGPACAGEVANKVAATNAVLQGYLVISTATEADVFRLLGTNPSKKNNVRREALTAAFCGYMKKEESRLAGIRLALVPLYNSPDSSAERRSEDMASMSRLQAAIGEWTVDKRAQLKAFDTAMRRPAASLVGGVSEQAGVYAEAAAVYARVRAQRGFLAGYGRMVERAVLYIELEADLLRRKEQLLFMMEGAPPPKYSAVEINTMMESMKLELSQGTMGRP